MVFFGPGSAKVDANAALVLKNAAIVYRQFPNCILTVAGYTDAWEAAAPARRLDARRAEAVIRLLRRSGVTMRVKIEAYGDTYPIVDTPKGVAEAQNRRVVLPCSTRPTGSAEPPRRLESGHLPRYLTGMRHMVPVECPAACMR
jgi:outer membrane protein OmpA-like peptidoglycan-associated protein